MVELPLASDEQISLITDILSDRDETEVVKRLHGDDAQSFVDMIDKVLLHPFVSGDKPTDLKSNFVIPSRRWIG